MASIVQSCAYRLRRGLWHFQHRQIAVILVVLGMAFSLGLKSLLPVPVQLSLWAILLVTLAWLLRGWGRLLFGPVLFYDLVRSSRRGEQSGHRFLYAIALVCVLAAVYWSWFPNQSLEQFLRGRTMSISERARFANSFFASFVWAQFVVVFLITPLYTSGAIAEQKEWRTLDFLLLTDLSNREIVLGMLGARLAKLLLLVMTGLPVLSLLEFLGGVDPSQVLAAYICTCMLVASLGSLSILVSVHARTALGAVVVSYLGAFGLVGLSAMCTAVYGANAIVVVGKTRYGWNPTLTRLLPGVLVFSLIQGVVAVVCCCRAVAQIRRVTRGQTGGTSSIPVLANRTTRFAGAQPRDEHEGWGPYSDSDPDSRHWPSSPSPRYRPRVGMNALLWKEVYAESNRALVGLRQLSPAAFVGALALIICVVAGVNAPEMRNSVSEYFQGWVRRIEIVLTCIFLLIVALTASTRVSQERERRTLDNLLVLPVSVDAILFAKWLGSILSIDRLWLILGLVWAFGMLTGVLNIFAVPLLAAATMTYAGFVACLGLWFSTVSGSTMRACLLTLLSALLFLAVPGALATGSMSSMSLPAGVPWWMWIALLVEHGLSPPATLWGLSFRATDLLKDRDLGELTGILAAVAGLHCYMAVGAGLWLLTRARLITARSRGKPHRGVQQ